MLRQFREDGAEVDLPIAQRTEAPGPIDPILVAAVHTLPPVGAELGVLDVEGLDARVVDVDEGQVVELLQHEVARVVKDARARVVVHCGEESFEGYTVMQVFARVQFVADVHAGRVEGVEHRSPALGQFGESLFHEPSGPLWPRVEVGPGERPREGGVRLQAQALGGFGGPQQLLRRPGGALGGLAAQFGRREAVEELVVSRVHGQQLPLQVGGQLGDLHPLLVGLALDFVAVGLTFGGALQIDQARVGGQLHAFVAQARRPAREVGKRVEGSSIAQELSQEDGGALQCFHGGQSRWWIR